MTIDDWIREKYFGAKTPPKHEFDERELIAFLDLVRNTPKRRRWDGLRRFFRR